MAGTIVSKTWGLAKGASAIAVRVLGNDGSGTNAGPPCFDRHWLLALHGCRAKTHMQRGKR